MKEGRMEMIEPGLHPVKQVHGDLFIVTGGEDQGKLLIVPTEYHMAAYIVTRDFGDLEWRVIAAPKALSTLPSG
ncbi:hypothetical protein LCGC14_2999810 [marine sediment metagenome]|uniref:Uncharacterized protein n=1 Tax=marine sediment metagenome TaxID=412755 RepID=A0A0F8XP11_9ZZZZ